ncbi:MAG: DNA cytosine methyltransferase [Anaerolineae bacterium]|nr:DNA cytosine methyltransferase [Anaerolineae bacterium]
MRVIDLFAGCGGLSLGFQNVGYNLIAAYDHWGAAVEVYRQNFQHPIHLTDLREVTRLPNSPDMLIGGPPCQDYSSAGKRDEQQGRADLTIQFAKMVIDTCPEWVVMENVDLIHKSQSLKTAKQLLIDRGYGLTEAILNASLCGVPQNRKRYFLVAELGGGHNTLQPYYQQRFAPQPLTVFDYLGDRLGVEHYYRHPRSYARRAIFSIYEPSPTIRGVNRPIPATYRTHPQDSAPMSAAIRPLTTIERSYLQTFPETFQFSGTKTDLEQMIGNAVPVKLAEFVATCIQAYIEDKARSSVPILAQLPLF